ncbi:phosphoglycerate kinase [Mycoplasmopsis columbinasalis]|uniref:Phosphoglycerate kinase n=1 Tax=Mycoplasmopsis columbinasalis TaxID=114880 RepID=A0A449BAX8_9BACT|nr:phosphoglycerate kinase [Mycoplasmopsis columbinasalis]VEU78343.1 Phosphoglycerate kinase [Mycoplasmopsis columbinasalis]
MAKRMNTLDSLKLEEKVVLLRTDFNVPIKDGVITSNKRIVEALPTIKYLLEKKARIVIFSHLGRIKTEADLAKNTLSPVASELARLLGTPVNFIDESSGKLLRHAIMRMKPGDIVLAENTRFEDLRNKAESRSHWKLSKYWARLGQVYVNDAFGAAHRKNASTYGIAEYADEVAIGLLMEKEVKNLQYLTKKPEKPYYAIVGGSKLSDKIPVLKSLIKKVDKIFIVGGMAFTFMKADGKKIGKSIVDNENVKFAQEFLAKYRTKVVLPVDFKCASDFTDSYPIVQDNEISDDLMGLDIGEKTLRLFEEQLPNAKTVVWNGPAGVVEFQNYKQGTVGIAKILGSLKDAKTFIGGGDSVAAIENEGLTDLFTHISTGGGATLEFLQGKELPALKIIRKRT